MHRRVSVVCLAAGLLISLTGCDSGGPSAPAQSNTPAVGTAPATPPPPITAKGKGGKIRGTDGPTPVD